MSLFGLCQLERRYAGSKFTRRTPTPRCAPYVACYFVVIFASFYLVCFVAFLLFRFGLVFVWFCFCIFLLVYFYLLFCFFFRALVRRFFTKILYFVEFTIAPYGKVMIVIGK